MLLLGGLAWKGGHREGGYTPVEDAHGVVVGLRGELFFGVFLNPRDEGVGGREGDVFGEEGGRGVEVWFSLEDGGGVDWDGGPAMKGDGGGVGGGHCFVCFGGGVGG